MASQLKNEPKAVHCLASKTLLFSCKIQQIQQSCFHVNRHTVNARTNSKHFLLFCLATATEATVEKSAESLLYKKGQNSKTEWFRCKFSKEPKLGAGTGSIPGVLCAMIMATREWRTQSGNR